jgi:hypothetical protein
MEAGNVEVLDTFLCGQPSGQDANAVLIPKAP